ncbi:antiviral reverse transcriptase Drt5 [Mesorhizobium sp. B4-1-1]|uniref:antiviral reverse transcriptase Drt5 n=1 Tax=Mesorhizobium sp. B4-1-1 TaxID=2589890 RepID=UPI00112BCC56|nr:antiviral reverse transcriptase Drt5 [Mesorhizobium sp. B4-1-1]TPI19779.1 hypothetical protein FJW10_13610 [Mesorhizobium sp. B4-1-1]
MARKTEKGQKPVKAPQAVQITEAPVGPEAKAKRSRENKSSTVDATPAISSTRDFFLEDFPKTLFPLSTNRVLVELGEAEIRSYIRKCLDEKELAYSFAPQKRVFVSKPQGYLRRTVKLDVVAEYYLYDVVYRNRALFRKPHAKHRTHYGYRFENGVPIAATQAYKGFKGGLADYGSRFGHSHSMDVATYFNSLYHHDVVSWFHDRNAPQQDAEGLGQLLREIAGGRSVDCLPQGLYPTKMIGNDFLRFVEEFHDLRSDQVIRFMDDIVLFANDGKAIQDDFQTIQRLIGNKGLSLNSHKTRIDNHKETSIDSAIDQMKKKLLRRRRVVITTGYDDDGAEIIKKAFIKSPLSSEEMVYIDGILAKPDIEEEDAELLLTIMRGYTNRLEKRLPYIIETYPHLAKNVHAFCAGFEDKEMLAEMILSLAKRLDSMSESQLFWFCAILVDELMGSSKASALISVLFNHRSATAITKAKILEVADIRFGLQDLRNELLANGQSDWLGWASAVGSRVLNPSSRNHRLKYWAKGSNMNHLIATIILKA